MIIDKGGTMVERGLYWNPTDGRRITMNEDGILPGDESTSYMRMSPFSLLVMAPVMGMMFVTFLPLFGIGVFLISWLVPLINTLAEVAITGVKVSGRSQGSNAFFNWHPTRAHFHGFKKTGNK
ncbi:MAG: hypothetical protein M0R70_14845 [Nitrospirae bacterium]|nr:hypothetical protein [Nitrospirota bacterium]